MGNHMAWATEQSCITPLAKLLAIYIANYHGCDETTKIRLEDAAAWCGSKIEEVDGCLYELHRECGLTVTRGMDGPDKTDLWALLRVPEAKNGGRLL